MNQLFKKHRAKIFSGVVLGAVVAMAVVLLKNTSPLFTRNIDAANDYTIQFNSTNGGAGFSSSYSSSEQINDSSRTSSGNPIRLTYKNVKKTSNKFAVMANGGYIYNPTGYQIIGLETINVTFTGGSLSLYSSKTNDFSGSATSLTSGTQVSIKANYDYFKIVSTNETTIDNIVMTYTCTPRQEDVTDVIKATDLTATDTSYSDFSGVKKNSSAVYAGNSAKDSSGNIQLRSKNSNSGLVSTTSGGTIASVKITVGSGSNTIDVYGSNTAYSDATDLYGNSQGTKVGSVTSTGTVTFTDSYEYVGIRSNNGAIYISSIEITWGESGGGGGDVPPGPQTEIYSVKLEKSNSGLSTSASSSAHTTNLTLSDNKTQFSVVFDAGAYNMSSYDEFRIPVGKSLNSNCDVKVKYMTIDYYGGFDAVITADGVAVTKETSSTVISGHNNIYDYQINSSNWSVTADSSYQITAYSITFYCEIEVGPVSVTGVSLNKSSLTIAQESSETLVATVLPSGATNKNVTWTSSNGAVASVDQTGKVTGNGAGNATITVETEEGGFTATCEVTVTAVYHVTGVTLNKAQLNLNVGANETLTATVSPSNATDKSVEWSSSNTGIATVSNNGEVHAVAAGNATITVRTNDGNKTATCTVTVSEVAVTSVTLNKTSTTLVRGGSETLTATVLPANATNKNITWSSSNSNIASVSNGTVTAVAVGTATITATSQSDSTKKATCTVTVNPKGVISISLNKTELALNVDQSDTLTVTFNPTDADDQLITWSTSNSSIATVSNGTVTARAVGSATITATSHDGNKTATCAVTVTEAPQQTTYEFTNKDWNATPQNWTSGKSGYGYANSGVQITKGFTGANATSPVSYNGVTEVVVTYCTNGSSGAGSVEIDVGSTSIGSRDVTKTGGTSQRELSFTSNGSSSGNIKITVNCTDNSIYICAVTIKTANIVATNVTLPNSINVGINSHAKITPTYTPAGANKGTALTWEKRSGSSTITVDQSGTVYVSNQATTSQSAVIRATLQSDSTKYSECTVHVVESTKDAHTILIYLCGSDLESGSRHYGTSDINEILSVSGQPDNVNIVIETGGANRNSTYFSTTMSQRWHLSNKSLVKDDSFAIRNMGASSTLQSFIEYGLNEYPAEKTGLILWNHGGGISGVCVDEIENHTDNHGQEDRLTTAEIKSAVSGALNNCQMSGQKLEWIGYDACLMGVADIASVNADYFNYMVGSEELEGGAGWNYDEWLPTLFSQPSQTTTILDKICKTFVSDSGTGSDNDATLAAYDLSMMTAFTSAFNTWSNNFSNSNWTKLKTIYQSSLRFGDAYHQGEYLNGAVDAKDFINKIKDDSSFSSISNTALLAALDDLVISNEYGPYYSNITKPCGITMFFAGDEAIPAEEEGYYYPPQHYKDQYSTNDTKFTHWRDLNITNGEWCWD